jgi:hypothetical protein
MKVCIFLPLALSGLSPFLSGFAQRQAPIFPLANHDFSISQMTKPRVFRNSEFNVNALLALASKLRQQPCTCDTSKRPLTGSLNWVIFVVFEDGVEWAF